VPFAITIPRVAATLAAAAALSGCGGGGGVDDASFDPGPVEIAKPGSIRAVGERAFVGYDGLGAKFEPSAKTTLGVTVRKVDEGDSSDIEGLGESTVPYYVQVEYENHGAAAIQVGAAGGHFSIRGSDGEDYDTAGVIEISGEFESCPDAEPGATLAAKEAINDCVVIPLTEGVSPGEVRFAGNLVMPEEAIGWRVE
jgi:hypothetical protein